jgi:MFS family permease
MPRYGRDAVLLFVVAGISALGFYGINILLRVLFVLRLGYGPEYVGLFNGVGALTYMGMGVPSGALGSRFGAKRVMLVGGCLVAIGMLILPLAEFLPPGIRGIWLVTTQVILIGGWAMFNVNLVPALGAATTAETTNSAYALSGALRSLGTFVGTVSGGLLPGLFARVLGQSLDVPGPYRVGMWVGALVSLAALVPLAMVRQRAQVTTREQARVGGRFPLLSLAPLLAYVYLHQVAWATCQSFCNAYLDSDLRLPVSSIGLISGVGQFLAILAPLFIPRLAARRGNGWTAMMTTLGIGLSLLPLGLLPHWTAAGVGRAGIIILWAVWLPALQVFQMELVDKRWHSLAYGTASMAMGLGFGTTSLVGGYVIAAWGYRSLFLLGAGVAMIGAAVMWGTLRRVTMRSRSPEPGRAVGD